MASPTAAESCPACGEPAPAGANWCEACGTDLDAVATVPCVDCGGHDISDDGYCTACGRKQPSERDRVELVEGAVRAISDRGKRHHHNEDAVAIAALDDGGVVVVVCDGVSSTPGSAEASQGAADIARDLLVAQMAGTPPIDVEGALEVAVAAAQERAAAEASADGGPGPSPGPPSTTFVAVVGRPTAGGAVLTSAWLGDSRAYWIGAAHSEQLTIDDAVDGSLTRWLGADAFETSPRIAHHEVDGPGRLIVCSDGLWRYADSAASLASLVDRSATATLELADNLVEYAIDGGGHDNITVAVWPVGDDGDPPSSATGGPGPGNKER